MKISKFGRKRKKMITEQEQKEDKEKDRYDGLKKFNREKKRTENEEKGKKE